MCKQRHCVLTILAFLLSFVSKNKHTCDVLDQLFDRLGQNNALQKHSNVDLSAQMVCYAILPHRLDNDS